MPYVVFSVTMSYVLKSIDHRLDSHFSKKSNDWGCRNKRNLDGVQLGLPRVVFQI